MPYQGHYTNIPKHYLAVDCVIFGYENYELKLLLHKRPIEPQIGGWSLMGGFCSDEESLETAANRVLRQSTGLKDIYLEQVQAFSNPERDPAARVISVAFFAFVLTSMMPVRWMRWGPNGGRWIRFLLLFLTTPKLLRKPRSDCK
jgi:8-oxo-dGTP diphosphatase